MALVNDATFLIYQLRVALVRSNDPLGARLMTFDDLAAPTGSLTAGEQQRRRQSSASSVRRQVAHNAQTNAYIAASGYSAEVDLAHSPELVDAPERPGGMGMGMSGYSGGAGRRRRVKEPEAVALADGPLAQGALAGPLPPVRRSLDTVRARPAAMVGDAADGSLSDGPTTPNGATGERQRLRAALAAGSAAASSAAASASSSATTATTTIRLQRPGGRKGSSRDAMALAVDFDVTKLAPPASSRKESSDSARKESSDAARKESSDSGRKSSDSMRRTRRIPLASLHERAGVKRSATLPAKRAARSRWAGAQAVGAQPAGWVGGPTNTWDHSSGSEDEGGRRRGATNTHTHTWYGPRTSMRASMFPVAAAVPPVPLLFGADSDDDIDLEGDEGSARTPAAMGLHAMAGATVVGPASPGMRSRSGSLASVRSRAGSLGANPQPRRASRLGLRTPQPASSVPAQPSPLATAPPGDAPHTPLVTPADAPFVPPPPPASGLAALLAGAGSARPSPLADEFAAIGAAEGVGFALSVTVHAATRVTLALRVRAGATVEQTIGFTLHRWAEEHAAAAGDAPDVAHWVLRIAEDGDVDDDFPVLDRARPVAQFGADEFALCAATPEQIRVNEAARARLGRPRPPSMAAPISAAASALPTNPGAREVRRGLVPRKEYSAVVLQPSRMAVASTAGIFVGTALLAEHAGSLPPLDPTVQSAGTPDHSRFLRIRVLPAAHQSAAEALHATTVEVDRPGATVAWLLAQVRRRKPFDEDYVLGVIERARFIACDPDMPVAHLPPGVELCLHRAGAPLPPPAALAAYERRWSDGPASTRAASPQPPQPSSPPPSATYHTFNVVRRAQMFARHDRLLVIDGEVVTLMPPDHRTESAKTLTLHIANIVCKRNQRAPRKIRLMLVRRSTSGDKSIDLEAASEHDADAICEILERARKIHAASNPAESDGAELI